MSDTPKPARKILIVDDERHVTRALERALKKEGYEITAVNDPFEALALLKTAAFDLVISDHLMPGMTGLEFTKLVRDRYPDMMRVMLTGQPDTDMVIQAINPGEVYRFVKKPWNDLELKVTLSFAFEQLDTQRENRRVGAVVRRWNSIF